MTASAARVPVDGVPAVLPHLDPSTYRPHPLHASDRIWPETNCSVDLWIELLSSLGLPPEPAMAFTVSQDFEGDQFTFFKIPPEDLESLYGLRLMELAIYDAPDRHAAEQVARGRLVLMEVDSWFLPDTRGVSYGIEHGKTTIGINRIDPEARKVDYFHNGSYYTLAENDYTGLFKVGNQLPESPFLPYTEFVKLPGRPVRTDLVEAALHGLRRHLSNVPSGNPVVAFRSKIAAQTEGLYDRPDFFHKYAFNTLRQLGANFELLAALLKWLVEKGVDVSGSTVEAAEGIASGAKTIQFQLARAVARRRAETLPALLDPVAENWDHLTDRLRHRFG